MYADVTNELTSACNKAIQTSPDFVSPAERTHCTRRRFRNLNQLSSYVIWIFCASVLFWFSYLVFQQHRRGSPITITTYSEPHLISEPITVTVCSIVFLDPDKILNNNGGAVDGEVLEFFQQTIEGNLSSDDYNFVIELPIRKIFDY